jgi:hypothetical protein
MNAILQLQRKSVNMKPFGDIYVSFGFVPLIITKKNYHFAEAHSILTI